MALRCAFPHTVYMTGFQTDGYGRSVTMQSISSSLKVRTFLITVSVLLNFVKNVCVSRFSGDNLCLIILLLSDENGRLDIQHTLFTITHNTWNLSCRLVVGK